MSDIKQSTSNRLAGLRDFLIVKYSGKVGDSSTAAPNGHVVKSSSEGEVNGSDDRSTDNQGIYVLI